jgi:hypothetical protein
MRLLSLLKIGSLSGALALTGCASIVSKSNWPVNFQSNPPGAEVVIKDNMGNEIDRGTTPTTFTLKSSDSFFSGATYYADFTLNDYQDCKKGIHADVNGWFWGNIALGGFIGMLVDGGTGAMYKLAPQCTVDLNKEQTTAKK